MGRLARFRAQVWPSFARISYVPVTGRTIFARHSVLGLARGRHHRARPLISNIAPRRFDRRNRIERKGRVYESCRRGTVGVAADLLRSFTVHAVLERPLGR